MPRIYPNKLEILRCKRCEYQWVSRKVDGSRPIRCPKCKTSKWDQPITKEDQSAKMLKWHALRRAGNATKKQKKQGV